MKVFELYHENSKLSQWDWEYFSHLRIVNETNVGAVLGSKPSVDPPCSSRVHLSPPDIPSLTLREALEARRSSSAETLTPITSRQLSTLLHFSSGLNGSFNVGGHQTPLRYYPSPGGLFPTTVWIEVRVVDDLTRGIYAYDASQHALVDMGGDTTALVDATRWSTFPSNWSCLIWLMARLDRLTFKYGERSYRFALLEAGHIAQNFLLVATAMKLSSRPIGGFYDDDVIRAVGLDRYDSLPLYAIGIAASQEDVGAMDY